MYIQALIAVVIAFRTVYCGIDETCVTPNKENATCIPVQSCTVIFEAVKRKTKDAIEFAKLSKCGVQGKKTLVCCGSEAYLKTDEEEEEEFDFDSLLEDTPTTQTPITQTPTTQTPTTQTPTTVRSTLAPFADFGTSELPDRSICGQIREKPRIFGGKITEMDEFPWMAALEYEITSTHENVGVKCGGSIINNRYVITAAHCVLHREFNLIKVRLGEWELSTDPDCEDQESANRVCADPIQNFTIIERVIHPFYDPKNYDNDIALIRLDREITYTDFIRPICVPPPNLPFPEFDSYLTVSGWGLIENNTIEPSDFKRKADIKVRPNDICRERLDKTVNPSQLCAGGEAGIDACQGDSGGPLMRTFEDPVTQRPNWYLDGIISFGLECGKSGYPGIYTRVSRFLTWIINTVSEDR